MRKYSKEAAGSFPEEFFDWLYLDASHTEEDFVIAGGTIFGFEGYFKLNEE